MMSHDSVLGLVLTAWVLGVLAGWIAGNILGVWQLRRRPPEGDGRPVG